MGIINKILFSKTSGGSLSGYSSLYKKLYEAIIDNPKPEVFALAPGLYQTGAIALYEEQGAEAIEGMMITSWDELLTNGTIHVDNGVVYTDANFDDYTNPASDILVGDLILPNDNSIKSIGDLKCNFDTYSMEGRAGLSFCASLTGVYIPDNTTSMGDLAFSDCSSLTSIVIPDGVTSIGIEAFYNCTGLTNIVIPDNVTSIDIEAFYGCSSLTSIVIPNGVTSISFRAFYDCSSLTSIVIPDNVTSIGHSAFSNCTSLTSVTIPNSVTTINSDAFLNCTNLTSITFNGSIEQWSSICKMPNWNIHVPATYVQCSDGQVAL